VVGTKDGGATVIGPDAEAIALGTRRALGRVYAQVARELLAQDDKWAVQDHDLGTWRLIAGEEDGEADAAILQGRWEDAEHELIQAIAVRVRLIEKLRRSRRGQPDDRAGYLYRYAILLDSPEGAGNEYLVCGRCHHGIQAGNIDFGPDYTQDRVSLGTSGAETCAVCSRVVRR